MKHFKTCSALALSLLMLAGCGSKPTEEPMKTETPVQTSAAETSNEDALINAFAKTPIENMEFRYTEGDSSVTIEEMKTESEDQNKIWADMKDQLVEALSATELKEDTSSASKDGVPYYTFMLDDGNVTFYRDGSIGTVSGTGNYMYTCENGGKLVDICRDAYDQYMKLITETN